MELKGKRIMFVCKETYSYPLYYIAKKWKKENEVGAFFFNPIESKLNKCYLNDTTYYEWIKDKDIKVYTSSEIADTFTAQLNNPSVDAEYLKNIEKKYTHFKRINIQLISSQYFTRHYHYRNYMHPVSYEQQQLWIELNYKNIEQVLDDFRPDFIVDCDAAELGRMVLLEQSWNRRIPYLTLESTRYDSYRTVTYTLGMENDQYFIKAFDKNMELSSEELKEEIEYINSFRSANTIMAKEFANSSDGASRYDRDNYISKVKQLYSIFNYMIINQDFKAKNQKIKKSNPVIYGNSMEMIKFYVRRIRVRDKLIQKNQYFEAPVEGERYVYMPLHLIPESTTFTKAPFYINELNIIEAMSKSLPIGWYLYVKEHQAMLGERSLEFYKQVKKFPNVRLVQLNYYKDPKPWIAKSEGVVTITGTSAYEAALLGKPAVVFGSILFSLIDGVTKIDSYEKLPELLSNFSSTKSSIKSCAAYIKTVKELGEKINLLGIMDDGLQMIRSGCVFSDEWIREVEKLERLLLRNIEMIDNGQINCFE